MVRASSSIFLHSAVSNVRSRSSIDSTPAAGPALEPTGFGGCMTLFASALNSCIAVANASGNMVGSLIVAIASEMLLNRLNQAIDVVTPGFDVHLQAALAGRF